MTVHVTINRRADVRRSKLLALSRLLLQDCTFRPAQDDIFDMLVDCLTCIHNLMAQDILVEYVVDVARKAASDKPSIMAQDIMWVLRKVGFAVSNFSSTPSSWILCTILQTLADVWHCSNAHGA